MTLKINLQNALSLQQSKGGKTTRYAIPTRAQFKNWVQAALQYASVKDANIELTIRLIDIKESTELNESYRHKKGPTNILSFPIEAISDEETRCYLGDLAICVPVVVQEAELQRKPLQAHWAHLTVHGVLHLLGYDHEKKEEAEVMEALEAKVLAQLGFDDPYE